LTKPLDCITPFSRERECMLQKKYTLLIMSIITFVGMVGESSAVTIEDKLNLPENYRYERVVRRVKFEAGQRKIIAELEGPGCIRHFYKVGGSFRNFILRIYWDGEDSPSVEAPVCDFFGLHHDVTYYTINSYYLSMKNGRHAGHACYFPMPFSRKARVEVEAIEEGAIIFTLDWHKYLTDEFDEDLRFHAAWRRESPAPAWSDDFFALDAVGRGYLLGFSLGVRVDSDAQRWTHAGSENFYIDGEATGENGIVPHYFRAAGGENSFDVSFGGVLHEQSTHLYTGFPFYEQIDIGRALARHRVSAYKFYVHDLLPFNKSLHFRWGSQANDMCITTYWYQTEPHRAFVKMPCSPEDFDGTSRNKVLIKRGKYDLLRQIGADSPEAILASPDDGSWSLYNGEKLLEMPVKAIPDGVHRYAFHGFIDFTHDFDVRSEAPNVSWPANASALTTLEVENDTPATLHLSWDDRMKIRINDEKVQDLSSHQSYEYQAVNVNLRKGKNILILNLENPGPGLTWGAWTFSCRCVLPDGSIVVPKAP
jgi:D-arabinan exo alpha-(1,3)/(1,5)-arabinofuranosidase (non-reducing end)